MKQLIYMRRILYFLLSIIAANPLYAHEFEVDGIYYNTKVSQVMAHLHNLT